MVVCQDQGKWRVVVNRAVDGCVSDQGKWCAVVNRAVDGCVSGSGQVACGFEQNSGWLGFINCREFLD
jgi:hypothetical protein